MAALLPFALGPAGLEADGLDAERGEEGLVLLEVGEVAVERLAAERPVGGADFGDGAGTECADARQIDAQRGLYTVWGGGGVHSG